ncbi:MAG TPA: glycosyltransferase [Phycisphaerae bacterium]|nr:glycosyltransferase [Phycisphaerae bacterium]
MRIGLIHKFLRPDTYGNYWLWTLRKYFPQHDIVCCTEQVSPSEHVLVKNPGCDVYIRLDDGFVYDLPEDWRPLIYYAVDTHHNYDGVDRLAIAKGCDHVLCSLKQTADEWVKDIANVEWMPHAAYFYPKSDGVRQFDVASAMNLSTHPLLVERSWIAMGLKQMLGDNSRIVTGVHFDAMAQLYASSKIVWNHCVRGDLTMRMFEAAACGACVVTNAATGLSDIFGDTPVVYETVPELIDTLHAVLRNPQEWTERGKQMTEIAVKHGYKDRMARVLKIAEGL